MTAASDSNPSTADREIVIMRTLNAPPEVVWRAWVDPKQIIKWWGPTGFTTTTHQSDVRAGGVWRFDMHGPDGRDYPNRIWFDEVVENQRLVYSHIGEADVEPVRFQTTVTFERAGDATRLTLRMVFESPEARDHVIREYGAVLGGIQTVGRLADHVGADSSAANRMTVAVQSARELIMYREFDAPREHVFDALTKPDLMQRWMLGPPGMTMPVCEIDLREGGKFRYVWRKESDGHEMGMRGVFREIIRPERLVHSESFDQPWYPGEAVVTTILAETDGKTAVSCAVLYDSQEARDMVLKSGMEQGMAASYDRLAKILAN